MKHVGKLLSFVAALFLALTAVCGALAESTPSRNRYRSFLYGISRSRSGGY